MEILETSEEDLRRMESNKMIPDIKARIWETLAKLEDTYVGRPTPVTHLALQVGQPTEVTGQYRGVRGES